MTIFTILQRLYKVAVRKISSLKLQTIKYLISPLFFIEVCAVAVGNGVRGDLMATGVQVLNLGVVGPLVRHVESSLKEKQEKMFTSLNLVSPDSGKQQSLSC